MSYAKTCTDCKGRQKGYQGDPDFFVELCPKHRAVDRVHALAGKFLLDREHSAAHLAQKILGALAAK